MHRDRTFAGSVGRQAGKGRAVAEFFASATYANDVQSVCLQHLFDAPPVGLGYIGELRQFEQCGVTVEKVIITEEPAGRFG